MPPALFPGLMALAAIWVGLALAIELLAWWADRLGRRSTPAGLRDAPRVPADASTVDLAFLGDVQRGIADVARPLADALRAEPPALLVSSGDLIAHGEAPYYGVLLDAFERAGIDSPFRVVPGNHDLFPRGVRDAHGGYALFGERFGPPYWAEQLGPILIVGVDNGVRAIEGEQLLWLDRTLERNGDAPWIAVCHRPPRELFLEHAPVAHMCGALVERIEAHPPSLCVCGHKHEYLERKVNGVRYIINAHGGDVHGLGLTRGPFDLLRLAVASDGSITERITRHHRRPWLRVYVNQLAVRAWWSRRKALGRILALPAAIPLSLLGLRAPLQTPTSAA